ncbi:2-phosphosulfolactate phosphatase [Hymenobacter busanensis]|uniref:Probable 2-phosphosulfolactate phosphatase n=1 Tax=Hymenobacter busanensis TaxID=2607656 RepID=A0A7L5A286_9BACT|nr:2-phosphosulfolactate phosphatase [Hymenobacter busanensis]KAA9338293.1 2-phosphosulfolactate phosphatase [Hymenobacter busanensis]QHJ09283.1 2-phosphosulfolactate phosphatase [Hymenobacter busanensis]
MPSVDICFSPELLPLYDLRGKVAVVVDILRATSSIVTALANGVTHVFPVAELAECAALGQQHGCLTAAERDGRAAEGFDLGNSPFGYLPGGRLPVRGRAVAISTTNGTLALRRSLAADAVVVGAFLNLQAVADFAQAQQKDVVVVCAGWKGKFCLEDTVFGGALAERLAATFDVTSSDDTLAALHLWQQARPDLHAYLLQSSHVRRLNSLEANKDFDFCLRLDEYPTTLPVWQDDRLVAAG